MNDREDIIGHAVGFAMLCGMIAYLFWNVFTGIKHGKVHAGSADARFRKNEDNGVFYFFLLFHLSAAIFFVWCGIRALHAYLTSAPTD